MVANADVSAFAQRLRNYLLHVGHAPITYWHHVDNIAATERSVVGLARSALLEWDGWGPRARAYIDSAGDCVTLIHAVDEYASLVRALYDWIFQQVHALHAGDLEASDKLRMEYNDLLRGRRP